ncbi:GHKL domain protein [Leptospira interrogans serovar Hebdomadis str. R499]|uniref:hybrid sensor histidine kinase/response regulator n=1 Tax=Leptospira interrogans TaxID=173 RepID=UPI000297E344|nr:ATP-binding protein [Leptospira interrogans]EKR37207.1 GHKL domain protein [Leptospira interrogans serovar Hebdomadis str. R499]
MFSDEISVCLIEDDDEDAILFREYLEEIPFPKYKVTRFKDFPSLFVDIEKKTSKYTIYVFDHFLGLQTGFEILNEIRKVVGSVSAVLISGISKEEIERITSEGGFQGYLEKKNLSAFTLAKTFFEVLKEKEDLKSEIDIFLLKMEIISQFSGGVAHDFNNILNIIVANLDILEMKCKDQPEVLNRIQSAQNAVLRGAEINKKLLNFSREQSLYPEIINPNLFITDFLEKSKNIFSENVQLVFNPGSQEVFCKVDQIEFANCIMNLLQNANEALLDSGGKILIETDTIVLNSKNKFLGLKEGNYFLLRVADNGKGIDLSIADRIFEPFFTTKQKGKNPGLGLPMVFGFVKRSGGRIGFESHLDVGSDFYIYLPIEDLKSDSHFINLESSKKTIFYFSNEGEFSSRTSYLFQGLGYRVLCFKDLNVLESNLSKIQSETILVSQTWQEDFSRWKEIVMKAQGSGLKVKVFYFSSSVDLKNSTSIPWPISRKSLENHFGIL